MSDFLRVLISYLLFLVPFISKTDFPLSLASSFGFYSSLPQSDAIRGVINAGIIGIFYILFPFLWNRLIGSIINRLTINKRMSKFESDIVKIVSYEEGKKLYGDIKKIKLYDNEIAGSAVSVLIDLLITDYREALEKLLMNPSLRVSLYIDVDVHDINDNIMMKGVLGQIAISEFIKSSETGVFFPKGKGFCGHAWISQTAEFGTRCPFPYRFKFRDKRYLKGSSIDKKRSFLCIPVVKKVGNKNETLAILCIDSIRKYDFLINENGIRDIERYSFSILTRLSEYIAVFPIRPLTS